MLGADAGSRQFSTEESNAIEPTTRDACFSADEKHAPDREQMRSP
jgi:hypothetical protein